MKTMKNKKEWGWALRCQWRDGAHGIFNSRKEAIKNAQGYITNELNKLLDPEEKILVGIVKWADPCDHLPEFKNILEFIRSQAHDNQFMFVDELDIFDLKTKNDKTAFKDEMKATKELQKLLSGWAEKWIIGSAWDLTNEEEITIKK